MIAPNLSKINPDNIFNKTISNSSTGKLQAIRKSTKKALEREPEPEKLSSQTEAEKNTATNCMLRKPSKLRKKDSHSDPRKNP